MRYWKGKWYNVIHQHYNGRVLGYLYDGVLLDTIPRWSMENGHIVTADGVVVLLRRDLRLRAVLLWIVLLILFTIFWPRDVTVYYQVTFAARPLYSDGVLYCNVINEANICVTVQFIDDKNKSLIYTLLPGKALPYVLVDFEPEFIRYNGGSDFLLEVQYD